MIETSAIEGAGVPVSCPECKALLYTVTPTNEISSVGALYFDGDTVPIYDDLTPDRRDGFGWQAVLNAGECEQCHKPLFQVVASFMDVEPDEAVEHAFFHRNADRGVETHFRATLDDQQWIVTRCDTPQGPMLEHEFGPFADHFGDWIGPHGVAACASGGPWDMARSFLLERWDELRLMPKALGLDAADPRARSHPALLSAVAARRAREVAPALPSTPFHPPSQFDDDIPF